MREPIANKTHYANGITLLDKQFQQIFESSKGPGTIPLRTEMLSTPSKEPVKAIIVPHSSIDLAGPCSAWAYKALSEDSEDTIYFIIAQAQTCDEAGTTMETFSMPYGEVRVEQNIVRELVKKGNLKINDELHRKENIIEVQLPFLQFVNKNRLERVKIVPIILNNEVNFNELSADIKEVLMELDKKAVFIFVTNLTSYGRKFHYVPTTELIPENIEKIDQLLITAIKNHSEKELTAVLEDTRMPLSGYCALRLYFWLITPKKITMEQYYLSGDLNNDYKNCVSYASFVIR
jgi:AmmeMemoRadiSam system protein B